MLGSGSQHSQSSETWKRVRGGRWDSCTNVQLDLLSCSVLRPHYPWDPGAPLRGTMSLWWEVLPQGSVVSLSRCPLILVKEVGKNLIFIWEVTRWRYKGIQWFCNDFVICHFMVTVRAGNKNKTRYSLYHPESKTCHSPPPCWSWGFL